MTGNHWERGLTNPKAKIMQRVVAKLCCGQTIAGEAKDAMVADDALRAMNKPIEVSTHLTDILIRSLPENLRSGGSTVS